MVSSALLVDDAGADRRTISLMMSAAGIATVHQASSALEAFRVIRGTHVELLVVDVLMPHTDGLTFLRTVRNSPRFATIPAIVITASREQTIFQDARAARADGYLLKPFTPGALLTMIQVSLRGKSPMHRGYEPEQESRTNDKTGRVNRLFPRDGCAELRGDKPRGVTIARHPARRRGGGCSLLPWPSSQLHDPPE